MSKAIKNNKKGFARIFLILGMVAASIVYWQAKAIIEKEFGTRLEARTHDVRSRVEQQVHTYAEVLYGLQANFIVHPNLSRRDFKKTYQSLALDSRLPGVHVVGFSARVAAASRPDFDANFQRELANNDLGYPTRFGVPDIREDDSYLIYYSEPIANNLYGIGKDQGAEEKRRVAIEYARDTGRLAVSERVRLFTTPLVHDGVVFFVPVYRGGEIPATLEQRRTAFLGVVFFAVRIDEMLHEVLGPSLLQDVDVEIYDLQASAGSTNDIGLKNILFDSGKYQLAQELHAKNKAYPLQRNDKLQIGGSSWYLLVTALPDFQKSTQRLLPVLAALSALLLSLPVFIYMRTLENRRQLAENRARDAERTLQSKEAQLARVSDSIDDVLWAIDVPGRHTLIASAATQRIYGRPPQAFHDNPLLWRECIHPADRELVEPAIKRAISNGDAIVQYRIIRPDNEIRWVQVKAHFIAGMSPDTGILDGIVTDITEQHKANEALLRKNRALQAIHACDRVIARSTDENSLLQGVCDVVVASGYRMAWAGIVNQNEHAHVVPVGIAGNHQGYLESIRGALDFGATNAGTFSELLRTRRPVVSNKFIDDERLAPWHFEALRRGFRAKLALPLLDGELVLGILNVYSQEEDAFDDDEIELLQGLAQGIATAVQSHRHRLAREAAEAGLQLRQRAIEACANPIAISRAEMPDYPVEYVNPGFEQVTGYAANDVLGKGLQLLCNDDLDQPGLKEIWAALDQQRAGHAVIREYRKDGTLFWADVYISPVRNESGAVTHFISAIYDITASKQYQAELEYQANYDSLTGLANRNLLLDRTRQAIARAESAAQQVWLVHINLDRFKFVNDTMGHEAGDTLLQTIAQRLQEILRSTDTAARVAADEFVLLMADSTDEHAVTATVQAIMQAIAAPLTIKGHDFFLTCSVGIAAYPSDGGDAGTLLKHADIAMLRAKEKGRNHFQFYTAQMNQRAMERLRLEGDLRHALDRNELLLHYQPQVDVRTGRIVGAEALLRWHHPQLGMVPPDRFIRIAEESGLIVPIGTWVMRTACQQNKAWQDAGFGLLRIAVNLSGNQFYQPNLIQSVATILQESGLSAYCLDIELTEGLVMHDVEQAVDVMRKLKSLGVKLSIDDFGTGYSSLSYLRRFPIDVLKVDQSFVRNVTTDPEQAAIAGAIITLAQSLHLQVIAEGVETEDQLAYLRRLRCDEIQGFYFSRPLPAQEFAQLLAEDKRLPFTEDARDSHQQTLLILDDEENVTASLNRLLRKDGYRILRAHTVDEGFALLARHDIQVVLCDQRMPGMTGTEFLSKVKAMYPQTIRIMLSGYTAVESIIEATNSGAVFRFHTKPWDDEVLRNSITEAFQYHWHKKALDHPNM